MIIHPSREGHPTFEDIIADLNQRPKPGDSGHTDDHGRIAKLLFDVPQDVELGTVVFDSGTWFIAPPGVDDPEALSPSNFAEVRSFIERPGVMAVSITGHEDADGVTDLTDEEAVKAIGPLSVLASGTVGLTYVAYDLVMLTIDLRNRIAALEAAQG